MASNEAALMIEDILAKWLRKTGAGRGHIAELGFEGAMDALWELLNAGFVKIEQDGNWFDIVPVHPPSPPLEKIARPKTPPGFLTGK